MPNLRNFSGCSTGYWTSSCSSLFTFSSPPTSFQVTVGTSTTHFLRAEGVLLPMAYRKLAMVMARLSSTSASMVSSSRSIRSIFSLICWRAASLHSAAMLAPT